MKPAGSRAPSGDAIAALARPPEPGSPPGRRTAGTCYAVTTGQRVDCNGIEKGRREARDRLEVSDLVIRGSLVQSLTSPRR